MKNSKDNIRCFKFFGKFAWQNDKKYYLLLIANIIVNSVSPFITIIGSQYLIDEIADSSKRNIGWVVFWVAFICVGNFICSNIRKFTGENISRIGEKFDRIFKTNLCMSCINMKFKHTEDTEVLDTIKNAERALNETGQVNGLITALANIITNFIVALGVVTLVCTRIPWLMIPVIISFVANSYTTSKVNKSRRKFFKEMGNVERGSTYYNTELQENRYAKDVRLYDASEIFEKKYDGYVDRIYNTSKKYHTKFIKYWNVNNIFYAVCDTAIYILLAVNIFNKVISIGEFSSLFQATSKFGGAIRGIVNSYLEMNYTSSVLKYYIDFVEDIYGENDRLMDLSDCVVEVTDKACEIEFRDVSFKYPNTDKYILKDISVKIKAGEHLAIVGQKLDAFGCHGIGGIWGGIATGIFGKSSINPVAKWDGLVYGEWRLFVAQIEGILITIVIAVVGTLICVAIVRIFTTLRVTDREERIGLDISQHGENAYPSFNGMDQ